MSITEHPGGRAWGYGWNLLAVGFALAVWLDPWSFGEHDPAALVGSPRMAARHAQAVVIGMGFLQLAVGRLLARMDLAEDAFRRVDSLSMWGATVYAGGYLCRLFWPEAAWLIITGALLNLAAFVIGLRATRGVPAAAGARVFLFIFCGGMAIDALTGLFAAADAHFLPAYLGPEDGVRMRMLRLARAAVIALSLLTLLYQELAARATRPALVLRGGRLALLIGAAGMPLVLAAAAFTRVELKYLLPIPADATFLGTLAGVWLAWLLARPLERWGWLLIAASMAAGLLMGLYAFDGPLASPPFVGTYNELPRRLSRLAHAYCIVFGLLAICASRRLWEDVSPRWGRVGVPLLVAGSVVTLVGLAAMALVELPTAVLGVGPALVAAGVVLCQDGGAK